MTSGRRHAPRDDLENHGGIGPDRQFALARITETIDRHNADIVALKEVDSRRGATGARSRFELLREAVGEPGIEAKSISTAAATTARCW